MSQDTFNRAVKEAHVYKQRVQGASIDGLPGYLADTRVISRNPENNEPKISPSDTVAIWKKA